MNKRKNEKLLYIFICLTFFVGILIFLYPSISDFINSNIQKKEVQNYKKKIETLPEEEKESILTEAQIFNENLLKNNLGINRANIENTNYDELLSLDDSGMMGTLVIKKIDVNLPIFHGTDSKTLKKGIGHYEGSSLPVEGKSTHVVLMGHTGSASGKFITDLDKIVIGDTFSLEISDKTYNYEVDQIKVVEPTDKSDLEIIYGKQYVTIVTCTPYGINSHRLLVRGELKSLSISTTDINENINIEITEDASIIDQDLITIIIMFIIIIFILLIVTILKISKRKKS